MVPSRATSVFVSHLVKEGIVREHLQSLVKEVEDALDAYEELLADKKWSIEVRIVACQTTDQLSGILDAILAETDDESLKRSLTALKERTLKYRKLYEVKGIERGDFSEVYSIIQKTREKVEQSHISSTAR